MDLPNDTVIESHGRVQVCATLTDGTLERTVYVNLSTRNNNATSADPVDFSAVAVELQFNETTSRACADIPITDDNRVELPEIFTVEISSGDPDVDFKPSTATVTILDNDMVMIGFEMERYQGEEGENVGVCVLLSGTLERSVVVEIITGDISIEGLMCQNCIQGVFFIISFLSLQDHWTILPPLLSSLSTQTGAENVYPSG